MSPATAEDVEDDFSLAMFSEVLQLTTKVRPIKDSKHNVLIPTPSEVFNHFENSIWENSFFDLAFVEPENKR